MRIINLIQKIITNPNIYIAAFISILIGLGAGGTIGMFAGGFIAYTGTPCTACLPYSLDINLLIPLSMVSGLVLGALAGAAIIGSITVYQIHNTCDVPVLSATNIDTVLKEALAVSIELAIGMLLGAIIGSLKQPGYGSLMGALFGMGLILIPSSPRKKPKK